MKTNAPQFFLTLLALTAIISMASCSKEEPEDDFGVDSLEITEEEAVEIIEASLQVETAGLTETSQTTTEVLYSEIEFELNCDTIIEKSYPFGFQGNNVQASFNVDWSYEIACNGANVPQSAEVNFGTSGSYSTARINSNDSSSGQFSVSGLQPSAAAFLMSGNYSREGTQTISFNQNIREVTSSLSAELTNLLVDKADYRIDSGVGVIQLTVANLENTATFEGSIVFKGNRQATVTINGNEYDISL